MLRRMLVGQSNKIKLISMYNSHLSVGSRARQSNGFKASLGNNTTRNNSEVAIERQNYYVSSSKSSHDAPEWMSRTQSFHSRDKNRRASMFTNPLTNFQNVQQTYVYARLPRPTNPEGPFERVTKPRWRNTWEMKNHTFEMEWPKPEPELKMEAEGRKSSRLNQHAGSRPGSRQNEIMRVEMPKYGYFQSPMHRQKETPVKIGHPQVLNSTHIQ